MVGIWRDVNTLTRTEGYRTPVELKCGFAGYHKEKLARSRVKVFDFASARRDALPNHAEVGVFEQMPAITVATPRIVLGNGMIYGSDV